MRLLQIYKSSLSSRQDVRLPDRVILVILPLCVPYFFAQQSGIELMRISSVGLLLLHESFYLAYSFRQWLPLSRSVSTLLELGKERGRSNGQLGASYRSRYRQDYYLHELVNNSY